MMIKAPDDVVTYAVICEKFPNPCSYYREYDCAVKWAKSDQPANRPYYIVKRTEHFEICEEVGKRRKEKMNGRI